MTDEEFAATIEAASTTLDGGAVFALAAEAERARTTEGAALAWLNLLRESFQALDALKLETIADGDDVSFAWEDLDRVRRLMPRLRALFVAAPTES